MFHLTPNNGQVQNCIFSALGVVLMDYNSHLFTLRMSDYCASEGERSMFITARESARNSCI
jgi:hypothetical protein